MNFYEILEKLFKCIILQKLFFVNPFFIFYLNLQHYNTYITTK